MDSPAGAGFKGTRLDLIKSGLGTIIDQRDAQDRTALVSYDSSAHLRKGLDSNHELTRRVLQSLSIAGGTNAEPAIRLAQVELDKLSNGGVIIHLTDGESSGNPEQAAQDAKDAGTQFYAIAVGDGLTQAGIDSLKAQASEPEGVYFYNAVTPAEFDIALAAVGSSLSGGLNLISSGNAMTLREGDGDRQIFNEVSFRQDTTTPANNSEGGDSGPLPLPSLVSAGSGADIGTVRSRANGAHDADAQTAATSGEATVSQVSILFNGAEVLRIDGGTARSTTSGGRVSGTAPGSSVLDVQSQGSADFVGVTVAGTGVPLIPPNSAFEIPQQMRLVLNEQQRIVNANTSLLAVTLARLELLDPADGSVQTEIRIGNSLSGISCGGSAAFGRDRNPNDERMPDAP